MPMTGNLTEQFEIFDRSGRPLGLAPRERVHREGLWHKSVNVYLFRSDGRLLLQRRSQSKDICPGVWDLSVGEHLQPGETYEQAARRGLEEELGVTDAELRPVGGVLTGCFDYPERGMKDCELQQSFVTETDAGITPAADEVAELALVDLAELRREFELYPERYTPWFRARSVELGIV